MSGAREASHPRHQYQQAAERIPIALRAGRPSLEWLAIDDEGEVVLSQEPEATLFMRLQNMLLTPFVPEQLL